MKMAFRVRRRLWQVAAVAILATAAAAWWIRPEHPTDRLSSKESIAYRQAVDREYIECQRLEDAYTTQIKDLLAAGENDAWNLAETERAKLQEQRRKFYSVWMHWGRLNNP
jgi:hypothetical protein